MWVHLPSSVSTPEAADSTWDSDSLYEALERSVTSNGKSRRARSWLTICKRASWMMRLFGQTPAPLTAGRGVAKWIGSLADSPASRSVSQESNSAPKTNAGSGPTSNGLLAKFNPADCSWRMYQPLFQEADWPKFLGAWPHSGTMRNGLLYERPTLARPTAGSGSSSWPTVRGHEVGDYQYAAGDHSKLTPTLTGATREWMTPKANEPGRTAITKGRPIEMATHLNTQASHWPAVTMNRATYSSDGYGPNLIETVENWATPKASNRGLGKPGRGNQVRLLDQAETWSGPQDQPTPMPGPQSSENDQTSHRQWITPRALNLKGSKKRLLSGSNESVESQAQKMTGKKRLNPKFVEWLMGLPEDWLELTASESSATE